MTPDQERSFAADSRIVGPRPLDAVRGVVIARITAGGQRENLPGAPPHALPDHGVPVDPAGRVPQAPVVTAGNS
jgi:hypothetical protein